MDECIDLLGDSRIFSTLDANRDYWQLEVLMKIATKLLSRVTTVHFGLFGIQWG